jgi:hypothetical protein
MSRLSQAGRPMKLKRFVLAEVPIEMREQAAIRLADQTSRSMASDRGIRATAAERFRAIEQMSDVMKAAKSPSDRGYWIPEAAWLGMIERAERMAARQRQKELRVAS